MHIIRSVLYFSVSVLRFFIPQETMPGSPHPYIPALHRGKRDSSAQNLSDWATAILTFHQSPDAVLEWQIVSVKWYKSKSGLEHEYPVFTLRNKTSPDEEIYLRFDRRLSVEALDVKKEQIVVKQDIYSVRSVLILFQLLILDDFFHIRNSPQSSRKKS